MLLDILNLLCFGVPSDASYTGEVARHTVYVMYFMQYDLAS